MLILLYLYFFFFSQKTADELRISDCSSDVCSSDLSASASRATINSATVFPIACAAMSEADACPKAQARTSRPRLATRPSLSRHTSTVTPLPHVAERFSTLACASVISEARRVGKKCVSTCIYRWFPSHKKNNTH